MDSQHKQEMAESMHVDDATKLDGNLQRDKVMSAELANALIIDHLSPWSLTGLKLSWLVAVTGISKFIPTQSCY